MSAYSSFAEFYDGLMSDADYKDRADYILKAFDRLGHKMGITLDLACGTGSLTLELAKRGVDVYGVDSSPEMLMEASAKAAQEGLNILFLCQKMQKLDLYGTVDTCVCTLDSINHLTGENEVLRAFERVSLFLEPDGYFLFDVNTVYKHRNILSNNAYIYDTPQVFCAWQNEYLGNNTVRINLDFFKKTNGAPEIYERYSEEFCEKAYTDARIRRMLDKAGMEVVSACGDLSFEPPSKHEQRVIYVARKK